MTFEDIAARFAQGRVPHYEYLAITGDLARLGFRHSTPGLYRHEWGKGRHRLRLAYDHLSRTWTWDTAGD